MQMLSTEHLRLSTMQEQRKMRESFHSHRDGSFWQKHFADMVSVHLIISWRMLRQRRQLEPYCYGQFTEGKASPNFGRSHVHWLTGTASTVMVGCVEGILGMRPDFYGLRIAPSIPKEWEKFEISKDFRGCHLHITVKNPGHVEAGCKKLYVNGEELPGNYIPQEKLTGETEIEFYMS